MISLTQSSVNFIGERHGYKIWQSMMSLFEGQENPFVLQKVQHSGNIIQRRNNKRDTSSDTLQLGMEKLGVSDMFHGMRTKNRIEFMIFKWQIIDVVYQKEARQFLMLDNIDVQSTAVCLAATDVQIPLLTI